MGEAYSIKMGDPATDLTKTIMPVASQGGIYDFSGTQASHAYAEDGLSCTKDEVAVMTQSWWDGSSDGWRTDAEFNDYLRTGPKVTIGGENYLPVRRSSFGDGDSQHGVTMKCKTSGSKKGAIVAHSDYTCCCRLRRGQGAGGWSGQHGLPGTHGGL